MTIAQYIAQIQSLFQAAHYPAVFQLEPSGVYCCNYNSKQVVAQQAGSTITFVSQDSTFNRSDDLTNPTQAGAIANAMMAYCGASGH